MKILIGTKKHCRIKRLSYYPVIFSIRRSFLLKKLGFYGALQLQDGAFLQLKLSYYSVSYYPGGSVPRLGRIDGIYRHEPNEPPKLARYLARRYSFRIGSFSMNHFRPCRYNFLFILASSFF